MPPFLFGSGNLSRLHRIVAMKFPRVLMVVCFATQCLLGQKAAPQTSVPPRLVAITIDDLPEATLTTSGTIGEVMAARRSLQHIIEALQEHKAPAIGFVNEEKLQADDQLDIRVGLLEMWLDEGFTLGNHTYSHADFQTTPLPEFEDEVVRGEVITGRLLDDHKMKLRYFRFPYNHTGPNKQAKEALLQFLAERNYISTPFTVEHADYIFDQVYASAQKAGDDNAAHRIGAAYLDQLDIAFTFAEKRARDDFGRDIPQVFLIHSNDINAEYLGVMLDRLQQRGYKFISLDEAMADPAYKTADDYVGAYGISWLHRWRIAMGKDASYRDDPGPPKWILDLYAKSNVTPK